MLLPKQIVALGKIVAKAAGRFAPSTVRIERHERGPRAIATDGRRAVIFQWDEPEAGKFPAIEGLNPLHVRQFAASVPPKALAQAGRGIARRTPNPVLGHLLLDESDASTVRIAATSGGQVTRTQALAEQTAFPDCDAVLPTPGREGSIYDPRRHGAAPFSHTRIGVNAKQLAQTLQVVSDLAAEDTNNTVVMTVPVEPNRPIRLDARCPGRRAAAVVMPVSADFPAYNDPEDPKQLPAPAGKPAPKPRRSRRRATTSDPQQTAPVQVEHKQS
jgi:hypothetical protein